MVFSSAVFLFIFLPVVLVLHTVIRNNSVRNGLLIVASLVFYAFGEPLYILLLIGSVCVNFFMGRILATHKSKVVLVIAILLNVSLLVVYKYAGFLAETVNLIPFVSIPVPHIVMPIGISFFTFQAISYIVDTYRADDGKKAGFFDVLLYISLFPQLIAGPIVKYNSIKDEIKERTVTADKLAGGMRRFSVGLAKKMLIANTVGAVADKVFAMDTASIDTPLAWLGAVCYTLQIYFDFSGYSDMAVGLGKCLGFDFPENFDHPYVSCSIREFWRRWHMSLTGWFREYIYIPMGGNRKGKARQILNTMVVFITTGIWHGANLTFILWGFIHGVCMSFETLVFPKKKDGKHRGHLPAPIGWIVTMLIVITGFVIFRSDTVRYGISYIGRMFSFVTDGASYGIMMSNLTPVTVFTLAAAVIACCPVACFIRKKTQNTASWPVWSSVGYILSIVLYILCVMTLAADSYNPFIYFRF